MLYLCSQLYVNFAMLWKEVTSLIEGHGKSLEREQLWEIFGGALTRAAQNCCGRCLLISHQPHLKAGSFKSLVED